MTSHRNALFLLNRILRISPYIYLGGIILAVGASSFRIPLVFLTLFGLQLINILIAALRSAKYGKYEKYEDKTSFQVTIMIIMVLALPVQDCIMISPEDNNSALVKMAQSDYYRENCRYAKNKSELEEVYPKIKRIGENQFTVTVSSDIEYEVKLRDSWPNSGEYTVYHKDKEKLNCSKN